MQQRTSDSIPNQDIYPSCRFAPPRWAHMIGNRSMFLSLSFSLYLSLSQLPVFFFLRECIIQMYSCFLNSDVFLLPEVFSEKFFSFIFNFNNSINIIAKFYILFSALKALSQVLFMYFATINHALGNIIVTISQIRNQSSRETKWVIYIQRSLGSSENSATN